MPPSEEKGTGREKVPLAASSAWSPFRHSVFRALWIATVVANIGGWMYNASAGWLMTTLTGDPFIVALVQVATTLPMFPFALPAGALADIIDKRRFILILEILISLVSAAFAMLVSMEVVTPALLLLFMFLTSTFSAWEAPAWQSIVPDLVPKEDLSPAVAANSVGINISRALGPALAGVIIAGFGIAAPFWLDAFSNVGVIGVLLWWGAPRQRTRSLPAERFAGAIRAGFRYARNNLHLRATLARAVGFFLFASAYWALLPLVARNQVGGGPELYGVLLGAIGAGAVGCAFLLARLKARVGVNRLVALGEVGTAITLVLFGLAREPFIAVLASVIAGISWIVVLANLNVSAQVALPDWVRGRGLAMYVTVFFATMTVGSTIWGEMAGIVGLPATHFIAASGALLAIPLTRRWELQTGAGVDLSPSMHWPMPIASETVEADAGPIMVTIEYEILPKDREAFLNVLEIVAHERKRDGAYAWGVFQDVQHQGRFFETFLVESWVEHLRQHQRVTNADRVLEDRVRQFVQRAPTVTHLVSVEGPPT